MKNQRLVIAASHSGDSSVGIQPTFVKITIESNVDLDEVRKDTQHSDNEGVFYEDIKNLLFWFDDMNMDIDRIEVERQAKGKGGEANDSNL